MMSSGPLLTLVAGILATAGIACCLDNGLARTPPMGWLSWLRYGCNTACNTYPDDCIGERLIMRMSDAMVANGYKDAGYEYITIDDCWPSRERDAEGRLQGDPERFPHGMKHLADYVHSKGLKFGLYEDVGRHTCQGFPGSQDHIPVDAQTYADWGIDMIKFDGCNTDEAHFKIGFPLMKESLNKTGKHILYSCEWPLYDQAKGFKPNYTLVAETCNTWRVSGDIYNAWQSVYSVINEFGDNNGNFTEAAGPGHFNDADMISVGSYGLSDDQERVQMGMWSMFASQMFLSIDLTNVRETSKALLQNPRVLAISQDELGIPGRRIMQYDKHDLQYWVRPVSPEGSFAIAYLNIKNSGYPLIMSAKLSDLGLHNSKGYHIFGVFDGEFLGAYTPSQNFTCTVNPNGICLVRTTPATTLPVQLRHVSGDLETSGARMKRFAKL